MLVLVKDLIGCEGTRFAADSIAKRELSGVMEEGRARKEADIVEDLKEVGLFKELGIGGEGVY